jgi:formate-dependent nitrite reductase membrane component NrfD
MKELYEAIAAWTIAGGLTVLGVLLFLLVWAGETAHTREEQRGAMLQTGAMAGMGAALLALMIFG